MRNEKKTELKVGITVFLGILITLWIIGWAKNSFLYSENKTLNVRFDSVAGLNVGDGVYINGVKKGLVSKINLERNTILVKISFDNNTEITKDAVFNVMMLDLMGGKKIEITNGTSSELIDFNQIQNGRFAGDISTTMAALGSVQNELISIIKDVKVSLDNINEIVTDKQLKSDIKTTLIETKKLINNLNLTIAKNEKEFNLLLNNSNNLVNNANSFLDKNREDISVSIKNVNRLLVSADSLISKINDLSIETGKQKNNLGKLLYDEATYYQLVDAIKKLNDLMDEVNKQLKGKGLNVDVF